ncbi:MAG: DUF2067 family protein [Thermocladium sp.]
MSGNRRVVLKFRNAREAVDFVDLLTRRVKMGELIISVRSNTVELRIRGDKESSDIMLAEALKIYGVFKARNGGSMDLSVLISMAQPTHSVPFDVVTAILNEEGYYSELSGIRLRTQAPLDEVINVIRSVAFMYASMANLSITQNAKKIIATHSHINGLDIAKTMQVLSSMGILREYRNGESTVITASTSFEEYINSITRLNQRTK